MQDGMQDFLPYLYSSVTLEYLVILGNLLLLPLIDREDNLKEN
jgi:hypothetical protein